MNLCSLLCMSLSCALACVSSVLLSAEPSADSWPQWGGPNRDHKSMATGLLKSWPAEGPKVAWQFDKAGFGYSSLAVAGGKAYSLGTVNGVNYAYCLDSQSGKELWRTEVGPAVPAEEYSQSWGGGPRSTPTVTGDRVIVLDDGGYCCCLDSQTGGLRWKVNLISDLGGKMPGWGYCESPLVDGKRVIICPGEKQFLVALDLETGKKVMASSGYSQNAHYASVIKHTVDGLGMYITACAAGLVGFSTETGEVLWKNAPSGNGTATVPTPIAFDRYVYHTSGYGAGCALVELKGADGKVMAHEVYANKDMQSHHGGVVLVDGNIFGYKKGGGFVCQDLMTGQLKWTFKIKGDSSTSIAYADQRIYVYGETTGTCYLIESSPTQWIEHGKVTLPAQSKLDRGSGRIWTHPVVAEGKLFLRDLDLIYAFNIRE